METAALTPPIKIASEWAHPSLGLSRLPCLPIAVEKGVLSAIATLLEDYKLWMILNSFPTSVQRTKIVNILHLSPPLNYTLGF